MVLGDKRVKRKSIVGQISDGKIFVFDMETAVRIRTREKTMTLFKKISVPIFSAITALITPTNVIAQTAAQKFDSGDTAWMLTATALVLLMAIPGLALFYGGIDCWCICGPNEIQRHAMVYVGLALSRLCAGDPLGLGRGLSQ